MVSSTKLRSGSIFVQRGRHAQNQGVGFRRAGKIGGGFKAALQRGGNAVGTDMLDIALAGHQGVNLALVDVKAQNLVAYFGKTQHQRQADIAQTDNADNGGFVRDTVKQLLLDHNDSPNKVKTCHGCIRAAMH
jgi:hypothetical protein